MGMNILAIKLKHVGDNLLATPALAALKKRYPGAHLTYLVPQKGGGADIFRAWSLVDEVFEFPSDYTERLRLARRIRQRSYDLVVDFSWDTQSALWGMISGAPRRIGYRFRKRVPVWPFYTQARAMGTAHTVTANLELVELADAAHDLSADPPLQLSIPDEARERAESLLRRAGVGDNEPILLLHPASRWMFKCWTDDGNAAFLDGVERTLNLRPVVTSGPSETEISRVRRILDLCKIKPLSLAGETSLLMLAALIQRAKIFVGVDSAPVHIASAVRTPVVVLFGPSGQTEWRPWQVPYRSIQRLGWSCCPCGKDGCAGTKRSRCLEDIQPDEVVQACRELLGESKSRS